MRHRLLQIFRISTLVLAVAIAALWPVSYAVYPLAAREAYSGIGTELIAMRGELIFYHWNSYASSPPEQEFAFNFISASSRMGDRMKAEFNTEQAPSWLGRRGFVMTSGAFYGPQSSVFILMLPQWVCLVLLLCPTLLHRIRRRLRRHPDGAIPCKQCGYDLRASPEICPECGATRDQRAAT